MSEINTIDSKLCVHITEESIRHQFL